MSSTEIGCCGAYCGTCKVLAEGLCLGCKLGYDTGERDITKAKCNMKVCCVKKHGFESTCADCVGYLSCHILQDFYGARTSKVVFRICPIVKSAVAVLFFIGSAV